MIKDLTVTVCTLNEERNIADCLKSIKESYPEDIIVVDANSKDRTKEIISQFDVRILQTERKGLAFQRSIAIDATKTKYVCILDADHRVKLGSLEKLISELEKRKLDGIEAQILQSNNDSNYWNECFDINFKVSHNIARDTNMIGTPCIYKSSILKDTNFDPFFTGPSDDTDLCYRLTRKGYKLGVGSAEIFHKHRTSFPEFYKKMIWYGKGDAQFIFKHPIRIKNMLYHQLINYPLVKNYKAIKIGRLKSIPFFLMFGYLRFLSMLYHLFYFIIFGSKDKNIFRT